MVTLAVSTASPVQGGLVHQYSCPVVLLVLLLLHCRLGGGFLLVGYDLLKTHHVP